MWEEFGYNVILLGEIGAHVSFKKYNFGVNHLEIPFSLEYNIVICEKIAIICHIKEN